MTTFGLVLSATPARKIAGSQELAIALVYLFVARMGAGADLLPDPPVAHVAVRLVSHVDVGGRRMHVMEQGSGIPVVMLHGNPSWSYIWRHQIGPIVDAGYRVIAPDLVGFGRSDKPTRIEDYTYARHVGWMSDCRRSSPCFTRIVTIFRRISRWWCRAKVTAVPAISRIIWRSSRTGPLPVWRQNSRAFQVTQISLTEYASFLDI